jgi:hypothetical protein
MTTRHKWLMSWAFRFMPSPACAAPTPCNFCFMSMANNSALWSILGLHIHEAVVHALGLDIMRRPGLSVKVANGERLQSYDICKNTSVDIQGEIFKIDCYTLPLEGFDVILGVHWLKSLGPIIWDFAALSMAFLRQGRSVRLHGCGGGHNTLYSASQQDDLMTSLLQAYVDIFATPSGLPPQRRHDHQIHLLPGTAPVAVRPYRYPNYLKMR